MSVLPVFRAEAYCNPAGYSATARRAIPAPAKAAAPSRRLQNNALFRLRNADGAPSRSIT